MYVHTLHCTPPASLWRCQDYPPFADIPILPLNPFNLHHNESVPFFTCYSNVPDA